MSALRRLGGRLLSLVPPLQAMRAELLALRRRVGQDRTRVTRLTVTLAEARARLSAQRTTLRAHAVELRAAVRAAEVDAHARVSAINDKLNLRMAALRALHEAHGNPGEALRPALAARATRWATTPPTTEARARADAWAVTSPRYREEAQRMADGAPLAGARSADAGGVSWWLPNDATTPGSLSQRIVERGWLPLDDIARVRRQVVRGVMLDIGANIGTTSIPRALLGDFDLIYAAEPEPANFACLVRNVIGAGLSGVVLPDAVALSSVSGPVRLRRAAQIGNHHLLREGDRTPEAFAEVAGYTLDAWVDRLGVAAADLSFVKVDVQGWDGHVLLGAQGLLAAAPHVVWQVEFSPQMMARTGVKVAAFAELVARQFTHVRRMERDEVERPSTAVTDIAASLTEASGYANLLLYNRARG